MYISSKPFRASEILRFEKKFSTIKNPELLIIELLETKETDSFVAAKKKLAEQVGVTIHHVKLVDMEENEALFMVGELIHQHDCPVVIQLPIPKNFLKEKFTALIPERFDIDLLHRAHYLAWRDGNSKFNPPIIYAVKHMIEDCMQINDADEKNILIIGKGDLVGRPIADYLRRGGVFFEAIALDTHFDKKIDLMEWADIIISGAGSPHHITPNLIKKGVVIIDCGTSEQEGVVVGDAHPGCDSVAEMISKTPGGVGPLCVYGLFDNLLSYYGVRREN